jgi:hypothetical protein
MKPRRIDAATRGSLAWWSRWCDWRSCLIAVLPETVIGWHRAGWRLLWRIKSRPGRPRIAAPIDPSCFPEDLGETDPRCGRAVQDRPRLIAGSSQALPRSLFFHSQCLGANLGSRMLLVAITLEQFGEKS